MSGGMNADEVRRQAVRDELDAVLDGLNAVRAQHGETLTLTRKQVDRWARQVGRALLFELTDDASSQAAP